MTATALKTETQDIVVDEVVPHTADVVWKAITDKNLIGRWLMAPQGFAPVVGTRFTYQTTPGGAWDGVIHCEVLAANPTAVSSTPGRAGTLTTSRATAPRSTPWSASP